MAAEQEKNLKKQLTYIGHATVLIELDGVRLLTDPILRSRVAHLNHRNRRIDPAAYQSVDTVLISHLHGDHLDWPSLRHLGRHTHLIVPAGSAAYFQKQGFHNLTELQPDQETKVGKVTVRGTTAVHGKRRFPNGPSADPLGYLVNSDSHTIYFAGDTDIFPEMADLATDLDVALLPVWGWGPTLGAGHLSPDGAAQALTLLRPQVAIPIHWGALHPIGMGLLKPAFLTRPPLQFAQRAAELAPEVDTHILPLGDTFRLGRANGANNATRAAR